MLPSCEINVLRLMTFVRRIARRLGLPQYAVQKFLSRMLPCHVPVESNPLSIGDMQTDADLRPLMSLIPQNIAYGSSICQNDLSRNDEYDLQIIIPVYNVEDYIERCMDSVLSQKTQFRYLVVVVNDGSTDKSRERLRRYENADNVVIIDQENQGPAVARNQALKTIRAKYVGFVDADDILLPGAIETLMSAIIKYDADVVEGGFRQIIDSDIVEGRSHTFSVSDRWTGTLEGYAWGKVFRAGIFRNVCFPAGYLYEDSIINTVVYPLCHRIVTIPDDVYAYRANPNGIVATTDGNPRVVEVVLVTLQLIEDNAAEHRQVSAQSYDNFLSVDVVNNFLQTLTLNRIDVVHHVFSVECRIMEQYFSGLSTTNERLKPLEQALRKHDYRQYVLAITTLQ